MMRVTWLGMLTVTTAVTVACAGTGAPGTGNGSGGPTTVPLSGPPTTTGPRAGAASVPSDRRVGAVFLGGTAIHTCTGAVLASASGDLVLTAAHCLLDGVETTFVPGFGAGAGDGWHVDTVYLDPRWITGQDPQADYAIVRVSGDSGRSVQSAAGGGLDLGSAPAAGTAVTVTGYPTGEGGTALGCRGITGWSPQGYPSVACEGLTDGFSGAPWVSGSTVTGLVGGLDGGGCDDDVSYSPRFDGQIAGVLARAEAGGPGDAAPAAFASDC
ncbi:serine protease [Mycolicibacterium sp. HK-90]|uniref:trypsin-like serine peptidase n=1 Tax=Mycolicibacterium sp. HK-90 TaxID=3056937 RepID=UPI0026596B33|nr:trypsin-like peptidase domain-containing protein [Mycolicibacterium sp. HK-90]WKG05886.1 trypsin-like peptidase domain-containing protein [Mycolicibacterium sp. HK-90]